MLGSHDDLTRVKIYSNLGWKNLALPCVEQAGELTKIKKNFGLGLDFDHMRAIFRIIFALCLAYGFNY